MIIRFKNTIPVFLSVIILIAAVAVAMSNNKSDTQTDSSCVQSSESVSSSDITASSQSEKAITAVNSDEMRAMWVPYMSLNTENNSSEESFKAKFDEIVINSKNYGCNTLIVHVRPFGDSLYPSQIFPWSHILTGTQGQDPGFDPLKYMVEKSHKEGLKIQAWINPLRIQSSSSPKSLSSDNLYNIWRNDGDKSNDDYVCDVGNDKYFNPAYMQVQAKIIAGIKEIVSGYDVDGIQFDDYFYPTEDESFDKTAYSEYLNTQTNKENALSLTKWRQNNINMLIMGTYDAIKNIKKEVEFGISPQCNIENDLKMGADVYTWGSISGYVDYLCPQIYVSLNHPVLPFAKSADQWRELVSNENVKLYCGLAVYKAGSSDADSGTWQNSSTILKSQIEYVRQNNYDGIMFYSYDYMDTPTTKEEVVNAVSILK